ncbi:hypothetical protein M427DRAFT_274206 [Gonapodya prolifera JEL478]|uniref:Uncharacterized protein n=1 Tax=Gonapodya prolifera (strain JEL478) TaxID=1344416 RepID=A0A139AXW6_GONPJ|nr:hypothetical protein M427DRAFT_274206 [Gonapodya prolifera JEL478]|eukprot:KXS21592.1 hypothetical protein M427DRAFT_274206 [Gonapodya prolifera JEL478]
MDLAERCCYPYLNHVVLCNSVYPKTPGHEGPNQANLSRLLFYASSRPHKLPKIGRYIEARAKKDFYAARIGYVKITLTILEAIVQRCTDHLGLFLPYALSTLDEVVGTADLDLVIVATGAFTSLSRHIDYPSLLLSPDLSRQWMTLVKKYADMCESETGGKDARHRFRLSGLKALESLLASESLALTPGTETYVKVALPAAMKNMAVIPPDVEVDGLADEVAKTDANGGKEPPSLPPHHSIADDLITDAELSKIAERCAAEAAARIGATQGGARLVVGEVVAYLDSAPLWSRPPLVQHILHVLLHNLRPPHRALLAALVSSRLARSPPVPPAAIDALLAILTESIRTSSDAAPLAAMEALDAVSRGVGRAAAVVAGEASSEDMAGALPVAEAAAAAEGVAGAVARAVAEKNAGEVVGFLANRVRAAGIGKESSLAGRETRKVGMRCLVRVAREAGKVGGKGTVPMEVVEGMAAFVNDGEADTRVEFAKFLVEVLAPSPGSATESPLSPTPTHSLFVSDLLRRLHTQTLDSRSTPADYAAARAVLEAVAEGFEGGEGEAAGTAMQIQDDSLSRLSTLPSHLRAANGVVVAFFSRLARARRLEALRSHVEDVRRRREGKGEWPVGWDVEADSDSWGKMLGQLR